MTTDHRLLVFSDDWGRHPSSSQHLVRQLLDRCEVVWFNTIGMRPPRLDLLTLRRGLQKLGDWRPGRRRPPTPESAVAEDRAPHIHSPPMWPSFQSSLGRALNRRLLARALTRQLIPGRRQTVLTTIPIVADLVGHVPVDRWVYYCVDDFSSWPGLDGKTLDAMERQLVSRVDAIVAAGDNLAERMRALGREATVLPHGVDLAMWREASSPRPGPPLLPYARPLALFWGLVDRRLDLDVVRATAQRMAPGTLVLVGPEQNPDPALDQIPHVVRHGPAPFQLLPQLAREADVLVMPYADLPVTRAMQPLKLKEYLATGKPVVVRRLPATGDWADCLDEADSPETFAETTARRLGDGISAQQVAGRRRLEAESWTAKAQELEHVLWAS